MQGQSRIHELEAALERGRAETLRADKLAGELAASLSLATDIATGLDRKGRELAAVRAALDAERGESARAGERLEKLQEDLKLHQRRVEELEVLRIELEGVKEEQRRERGIMEAWRERAMAGEAAAASYAAASASRAPFLESRVDGLADKTGIAASSAIDNSSENKTMSVGKNNDGASPIGGGECRGDGSLAGRGLSSSSSFLTVESLEGNKNQSSSLTPQEFLDAQRKRKAAVKRARLAEEEVVALREALASLSSARESLQGDFISLKAEREAEVEIMKSNMSSLKASLKNATQELEECRLELREARRKASMAAEEASNNGLRIADLDASFAGAEAARKSLAGERADLAAQLETASLAAGRKVAQLESSLTSEMANCVRWQKMVAEAEARAAGAEAEVLAGRRRLQAQAGELEDARARLRAVETDKQSAQEREASALSAEATAKEECVRLREACIREADSAEREGKRRAREVVQAEERVRVEWEGKMASLASSLEAARKECESLRNDAKEALAARSRAEALSLKITEDSGEARRAAARLGQVEEECNSLKSALLAERGQTALLLRLRTENAAALAEAEAFRRDAETMKSEMEMQGAALEEKSRRLGEECERLSGLADRASKSNESLIARLASTESEKGREILAAETKAREMEHLASTASAECSRLRETEARLKREMDNLTKETLRLTSDLETAVQERSSIHRALTLERATMDTTHREQISMLVTSKESLERELVSLRKECSVKLAEIAVERERERESLRASNILDEERKASAHASALEQLTITFKAQLSAVNVQKDGLQTQLCGVERELEVAVKELASMRGILQVADMEKHKVEEKSAENMKSALEKCTRLQLELGEKDSAIVEYQNNLSFCSSEKEALQSKLFATQGTLNSVRTALRGAEGALEEAGIALNTALKEGLDARARAHQHQQESLEFEAKCRELGREVSRLKGVERLLKEEIDSETLNASRLTQELNTRAQNLAVALEQARSEGSEARVASAAAMKERGEALAALEQIRVEMNNRLRELSTAAEERESVCKEEHLKQVATLMSSRESSLLLHASLEKELKKAREDLASPEKLPAFLTLKRLMNDRDEELRERKIEIECLKENESKVQAQLLATTSTVESLRRDLETATHTAKAASATQIAQFTAELQQLAGEYSRLQLSTSKTIGELEDRLVTAERDFEEKLCAGIALSESAGKKQLDSIVSANEALLANTQASCDASLEKLKREHMVEMSAMEEVVRERLRVEFKSLNDGDVAASMERERLALEMSSALRSKCEGYEAELETSKAALEILRVECATLRSDSENAKKIEERCLALDAECQQLRDSISKAEELQASALQEESSRLTFLENAEREAHKKLIEKEKELARVKEEAHEKLIDKEEELARVKDERDELEAALNSNSLNEVVREEVEIMLESLKSVHARVMEEAERAHAEEVKAACAQVESRLAKTLEEEKQSRNIVEALLASTQETIKELESERGRATSVLVTTTAAYKECSAQCTALENQILGLNTKLSLSEARSLELESRYELEKQAEQQAMGAREEEKNALVIKIDRLEKELIAIKGAQKEDAANMKLSKKSMLAAEEEREAKVATQGPLPPNPPFHSTPSKSSSRSSSARSTKSIESRPPWLPTSPTINEFPYGPSSAGWRMAATPPSTQSTFSNSPGTPLRSPSIRSKSRGRGGVESPLSIRLSQVQTDLSSFTSLGNFPEFKRGSTEALAFARRLLAHAQNLGGVVSSVSGGSASESPAPNTSISLSITPGSTHSPQTLSSFSATPLAGNQIVLSPQGGNGAGGVEDFSVLELSSDTLLQSTPLSSTPHPRALISSGVSRISDATPTLPTSYISPLSVASPTLRQSEGRLGNFSKPTPVNSPLLMAALRSPGTSTGTLSSPASGVGEMITTEAGSEYTGNCEADGSALLLVEASSLVWTNWLKLYPLDVINDRVKLRYQGSLGDQNVGLVAIARGIEETSVALSSAYQAVQSGVKGSTQSALNAQKCVLGLLDCGRAVGLDYFVEGGGEDAPLVFQGVKALRILQGGLSECSKILFSLQPPQ